MARLHVRHRVKFAPQRSLAILALDFDSRFLIAVPPPNPLSARRQKSITSANTAPCIATTKHKDDADYIRPLSSCIPRPCPYNLSYTIIPSFAHAQRFDPIQLHTTTSYG